MNFDDLITRIATLIGNIAAQNTAQHGIPFSYPDRGPAHLFAPAPVPAPYDRGHDIGQLPFIVPGSPQHVIGQLPFQVPDRGHVFAQLPFQIPAAFLNRQVPQNLPTDRPAAPISPRLYT